jgi:hypothetical protein
MRASVIIRVPDEADALRRLLGMWWGDQGWHRSRTRARLDPRRAARLAGKWAGRRRSAA